MMIKQLNNPYNMHQLGLRFIRLAIIEEEHNHMIFLPIDINLLKLQLIIITNFQIIKPIKGLFLIILQTMVQENTISKHKKTIITIHNLFDMRVVSKIQDLFDMRVLSKIHNLFNMRVLSKIHDLFDMRVLSKIHNLFNMRVLSKKKEIKIIVIKRKKISVMANQNILTI